MATTNVSTAVIPAAGLGTRFLPLTKAIPKELVPVVDRPTIHYVVQEAMATGIQHIVIVRSEGDGALEKYFTPSPQIEEALRVRGNYTAANELHQFAERLTFSYAIQHEQLGLGHAILCAKSAVGNQPFAVMLPDDLLVHDEPVLAQMLRAWRQQPGNYLAVEEVPTESISAYGVANPAPHGHVDERIYRLQGVVEKPPAGKAPSNLGIVGRYILTPEIFEALNQTEPGTLGEIQLTDGIARIMEWQPTYAYLFAGIRYDCGTPMGLLQASLGIALRRADTAAQIKVWIRERLVD